MTDETCPESVYRGAGFHERRVPCGKPVKRRGLCGIHARSADLADARHAEALVRRDTYTEVRELAGKLTDRFRVSFESRGESVGLTVGAARALLAVSGGSAAAVLADVRVQLEQSGQLAAAQFVGRMEQEHSNAK